MKPDFAERVAGVVLAVLIGAFSARLIVRELAGF